MAGQRPAGPAGSLRAVGKSQGPLRPGLPV